MSPDGAALRGRVVSVTGGGGFLGQATVRRLAATGAKVRVVRSAEYDLRDPAQCAAALRGSDVVMHLAANVGGIGYNLAHPAPLLSDNISMGLNVFDSCRDLGVSKLVAVCSVCAYPKFAPVPFREDDLWNGYPEESNAPYGVAKRLLLSLSDAYRKQYGLRSCVPVLANLYGPGDNFDLETSHVIPAMIRKFVDAKRDGAPEVTLWGTGEPTREFLFVDDAAEALVLTAERCDTSEPFNIGTGIETRILDLANKIARLAEYEGEIVWDASRPDGQPRRFLDVSRAATTIGFCAGIPLEEGLRRTIASYEAGLRPTATQPR